MMTSLQTFVCVFFSVLCTSTALSVPSYCDRCKINVQDVYCQYCCKVYRCCGTAGTQMPECTLIQCGGNPTTTSATTPSTTEATTVPVTTQTSTVETTTMKARNCALPSRSGAAARMLGGTKVSVCDRPWMVHFMVDSPPLKLPACSGVLISDTQILTSKVCVDDFMTTQLPGATILVRFADSEKYLQQERAVTSDKIIVKGDLAIVSFSPKVPLDADFCIQPVCLPDQTTVFTEDANQKCKIASWGLPDPDILEEADVSLMTSSACEVVLSTLAGLGIGIDTPTNGLCTNPPESSSSACKLDEGGMLLCQDQGDVTGKNWILAGITYGAPCNIKHPNTFVNVMKNLDFIKSKLM